MGLFKKKETIINNEQPVVDNSIVIKTTDEVNKLDGVVKIANIDGEKINMLTNTLPEAIDIDKRKEEYLKKKRELALKRNPNYKKIRNGSTVGALLAIILIIGGVIFYNYYINIEQPQDFILKNITLELGEKLNNNPSTYITRQNINEIDYKLDLTTVTEYKIGTYNYSITAFGVTKTAKIEVVDTTTPSVDIKEAFIEVGQRFSENAFIDYCYDLSNCSYDFDNDEILDKNQLAGEYETLITISDDYNNFVKKNTTLHVVDKYEELICTNTDKISSLSYEKKDIIKVQYVNNFYYNYTYNIYLRYYNQDIYQENKDKYLETEEYKYRDEEKTIIVNERYTINQNYSIDLLQRELENDGYTCEVE